MRNQRNGATGFQACGGPPLDDLRGKLGEAEIFDQNWLLSRERQPFRGSFQRNGISRFGKVLMVREVQRMSLQLVGSGIIETKPCEIVRDHTPEAAGDRFQEFSQFEVRHDGVVDLQHQA